MIVVSCPGVVLPPQLERFVVQFSLYIVICVLLLQTVSLSSYTPESIVVTTCDFTTTEITSGYCAIFCHKKIAFLGRNSLNLLKADSREHFRELKAKPSSMDHGVFTAESGLPFSELVLELKKDQCGPAGIPFCRTFSTIPFVERIVFDCLDEPI